ncbi:type VII secretion target [Mycobacterium sp. 1245852.3]|uniref:type VII secretion target n=1 Tax=Mycobacterium sp. 1245852.3 TaxID=1856860 RepID=UPI001E42FBEF|nr:type VII secretion target [Mycobacterium sp. 1245852.3]
MAELDVNPADLLRIAGTYGELAARVAQISPQGAAEVQRIAQTHGPMGYPVATGIAAGWAKQEGALQAKADDFNSYAQRFTQHRATYTDQDSQAAQRNKSIAWPAEPAPRAPAHAQMLGFQQAPLPQAPTTTSPKPDPPQCKPEDQAKLIKRLAEWCLERDRLTKEVSAWDQKYPPGHAFNMNDPAQAAEYERGEQLKIDRTKLIRDYGELLKDATTCGAVQDPQTGDILWPDGTRTTLAPPK